MSIQQRATRIRTITTAITEAMAQAMVKAGLAGTMLAGVSGVALGLAALGLAPATGVEAQERYSVWDGVYADEQLARGKEQYEYTCANCHIHDLSGDSIKDTPALAGSDFLDQWGGKTVGELLEYMSTKMPPDSPGSLDAKTYAEIAAYVLKVNTFPPGKTPLGSDAARLAKTFIDREPKK
jgi:mono/diheme cytochrome c family protein